MGTVRRPHEVKRPALVLQELQERGLADLVEDVCRERHLLPLEVCGRSRVPAIVMGRWEVWRAMRTTLGWTTTMIGTLFGVDHTSICHAMKAHEKEVETET